MNDVNPYLFGLDKCEANYSPLTPLTFLERTARIYPDRLAVVDGGDRKNWREVEQRSRQLASALRKSGIGKNDTVAVLAPNSLPIYEAHFGVPMAGAVLNTINTRLDAATVAFILKHGRARALIVDAELGSLAIEALAELDRDLLVVQLEVAGIDSGLDAISYSEFLESGNAEDPWVRPEDEWDACLLYTSDAADE